MEQYKQTHQSKIGDRKVATGNISLLMSVNKRFAFADTRLEDTRFKTALSQDHTITYSKTTTGTPAGSHQKSGECAAFKGENTDHFTLITAHFRILTSSGFW